MRLYKVGDRSAGICEACNAKVTTRMEYRDYTPPGWDETVPDVMVAACERCGEVVGIPHQSTPRINEFRKPVPSRDSAVTVEARIPREIEEALDLVTVRLGSQSRATRSLVMRYYLAQVARKPEVAQAVKRQAAVLYKSRSDRRVFVKVAPGQWSRVAKASKLAGINSRSDLMRGVALLAAEDCQITTAGSKAPDSDRASRNRFATLKQMAEVF